MRIIKYFTPIIFLLLLASCKVSNEKEIDVLFEKDKVIFSFQRAIEEEKVSGVHLAELYVVKREAGPENPISRRWYIQPNTDPKTDIPTRNNLSTVTYGVVPSGMNERIEPAQKLTPGEYAVDGAFFTYKNGDGGGTYAFSKIFRID